MPMASQTTLDKPTLSQVYHYLETIKKSGIKPSKVIVFGSRAKGTHHPYSDIDLCLVSDQFGKKNGFDERLELSFLTDDLSQDIEPHPMTPEDYNSKWYSLAHEIRTHGIEIK